MKNNILFHGSNVTVSKPKILINGYYKDFGYGFYCTNIKRQATRWALTKKGASIINSYSYTENESLKVLQFETTTEEWLQFVVNCRRGIEHAFDIVEDYMSGKISKAAFWELIKFKYPTHQIVFCTEDALKTLHFERSETL